jgi:Lon protease-like protein
MEVPAPQQLSQLPLFPLRSVLFPGGYLPLRIFEVRYLDMIGRSHKACTPFGVVCLTEGTDTRRRQSGTADGKPPGDGFAHEAFSTVGTLARITKFERRSEINSRTRLLDPNLITALVLWTSH